MTENDKVESITNEAGQEAAEEIQKGIQRFMVEDWLIRATYKNIRRMLVWIAKQRNSYLNKRIDLFDRLEKLSEWKVKDRTLKRLIKSESAYHMLGVARYDTVKWASELWFLERLQQDEQINQLIKGGDTTTEKQREIRRYVDELLRSVSPGSEVPGLPKSDSDNVWAGEEGEL